MKTGDILKSTRRGDPGMLYRLVTIKRGWLLVETYNPSAKGGEIKTGEYRYNVRPRSMVKA